MEPNDPDHQFDRRNEDVNVNALAIRVGALERRMEIVESDVKNNTRELLANTRITTQSAQLTELVHEAMFGREGDQEDTGVNGKVKEMHNLFTDGKRGLAMLNGVADAGARWGKPLLFLVLIIGSIATFVKTGIWKVPVWPT